METEKLLAELQATKKENAQLKIEIQLLKRPIEKITQNTLFKDISIDDADVLRINQKNKKTKDLKSWDDLPFSKIYTLHPRTHGLIKNECPHYNIGIPHIHDALRKLALAVTGAKKNTDLDVKEYGLVRDAYQGLKDLFLEKYDERLARLEEDSNDPTTNF